MYLINGDKLQLGDIILRKSETEISQFVRRLTGSQFSHAILYVGVKSIIDSDGYGVQSNNLSRLLLDNEEDAVVLRIKENINASLLFDVEIFARRKIGTEYSTDEAKIAKISKELEAIKPNRQFCTRFIAQAYESAGIKLVKNSDYCIPEELLKSDQLKIVENVLREASEIDIEFANSENPLAKQREIHNNILRKARELSGKDIQTFEQINELIIENQAIDVEFTKYVSESGYLIMMEKDIEKNPWHYSAEKMIEHYKNPEVIVDTALYLVSAAEKFNERLYMTLNSLQQLDRKFPREYFKMEIGLYEKLIGFNSQRETEALKVLKYF